MNVRFWGTRGSIPSPGSATLHHGGNSACVEVRTRDGQLIILDCGTGARGLGQALQANGEKVLTGHILISHTHWDHIQGFPFFGPLYVPGNEFTVYSARASSKPLQAVFSDQLDYSYFPVSLRQLAANLQFRELAEEEFHIGEIKVRTISLNHTVFTLGYRLEDDKHSIAYITDHEPYSRYFPKWGVTGRSLQPLAPSTAVPRIGSFAHEEDQRLAAFVEGVDLLIQDSQYLATEYPNHMGWGHSTIDYTLDVAIAAGVGRVALFHHDPDHDDALLDGIEAECQAIAQKVAPGLQVLCAKEGQEVALTSESTSRNRTPKVLVVEDDPDVANVLEYILREDGNDLIFAADGETAIAKALAEQPDLILLDIMIPLVDGYGVCKALRAHPATRRTPIIMLTARTEQADAERGFQEGATDFMTKPFAPAQVRARTRAWLMRTGTMV